MKYRVGIIGCGSVAQEIHLPVLCRMDKVNVVSICDIEPNRVRHMAKKYNISSLYSDPFEMISKEQLSIIDICTPPQSHYELLKAALCSNAHVIIEKPITMNKEENKEMLATAEEFSNLKIGTIYNLLYSLPILKIKNRMKRGLFGDIVYYRLESLLGNYDNMLINPSHWSNQLPAGRFGEMLIHLIYIADNIFGKFTVDDIHVTKFGSIKHVPYDELNFTTKHGNTRGNIRISFNYPKYNEPVIAVYGTKRYLQYEGYNFSEILRKYRSHGSLNKAIDVVIELLSLNTQFVFNVVNNFRSPFKLASHKQFFNSFIASLDNGANDTTLSFNEACRINLIYLDLLDELERIKPWK